MNQNYEIKAPLLGAYLYIAACLDKPHKKQRLGKGKGMPVPAWITCFLAKSISPRGRDALLLPAALFEKQAFSHLC